MGDPSKVLLLEKVVEVIKRDNLLSIVQASGTVCHGSAKRDLLKTPFSFSPNRQEAYGRSDGHVKTLSESRQKRARHRQFLRF